MADELIIKIQIMSQPLVYWQTNDPVIPLGFAAYTSDVNKSTVRHGDGTRRWSQIPDTYIDMYVPNHATKHHAGAIDALIATDAEWTVGTSIIKTPNLKQVKDYVKTEVGNVVLAVRQATAPANTNLLWLNTTDASFNYYDTTLAKWVSIVGRYADAP